MGTDLKWHPEWRIGLSERSFVSMGEGVDRLTVRIDSIVAIVLYGKTLTFYLRDIPTSFNYMAGSTEQAQTLYENLLTLL